MWDSTWSSAFGELELSIRGRGLDKKRARRVVPLRGRGAALGGMGALEGTGDLQEEMLVGDGANELEADRKDLGSEAAGHRDGGDAG